MPITITPFSPGGLFGPGLGVQLQSDFIGPLPSTAFWSLDVTPPASEAVIHGWRQQSNSNPTFFTWWDASPSVTERTTGLSVAENSAIAAVAKLFQSNDLSQQLDQGNATGTFTGTAGLSETVITHQGKGQGLTAEQSTQLQQINANTVVSELMDKFTLTEISRGPQGGVVGAQLPFAVFGVIVRIASVPDTLIPNTPDGDYWVPSLAVVRVFRAADLWLRVPIHTSSKMVPFWTENVFVGITAATLSEWLLQMTVQVSFREGVTGQVFLMDLP